MIQVHLFIKGLKGHGWYSSVHHVLSHGYLPTNFFLSFSLGLRKGIIYFYFM